jgi:hypothetical protein
VLLLAWPGQQAGGRWLAAEGRSRGPESARGTAAITAPGGLLSGYDTIVPG